MMNSLADMARARRLRALDALDGPRRTRPHKARLFGAGGTGDRPLVA